MKYILYIMSAFALLFFAGCGTTNTITTTKYNTDGSVAELTVEESDVSDFNTFMARGEGKATSITAQVTKFGVSQNGLSYLNLSGTSVTAPATEADSNKVLKATATVINATETSITTDAVSINASEDDEEESGSVSFSSEDIQSAIAVKQEALGLSADETVTLTVDEVLATKDSAESTEQAVEESAEVEE